MTHWDEEVSCLHSQQVWLRRPMAMHMVIVIRTPPLHHHTRCKHQCVYLDHLATLPTHVSDSPPDQSDDRFFKGNAFLRFDGFLLAGREHQVGVRLWHRVFCGVSSTIVVSRGRQDVNTLKKLNYNHYYSNPSVADTFAVCKLHVQ